MVYSSIARRSRRVDWFCLPAVPHSHAASRHNQELVQLISVVRKRIPEPLDFGRKWSVVAKPKEDDASVGKPQPKYKLTKIPVVSNEDATLLPGDGEHFLVGQTCWVVTGNPFGIVAKLGEVANNACICALVQQELHGRAGGAPAALRLGLRFSSTAA